MTKVGLSLTLSVAAAVAVHAHAPRAHAADVTADQLALLDADAAAVATAHPRAIGAILRWARSIAGQQRALLEMGLGQASLEAQKVLGFDPLAPDGLAAIGIDPDSPIVASIYAIDPREAERTLKGIAALPLTGAPDPRRVAKIPRTFARTRVVLVARDPVRAATAIGSLVRGAGGKYAALGGGGPGLGRELAVDKATAAALDKALRPHRVQAFGVLDRNVGLLVHASGRFLVVDVVAPIGNLDVDWKREAPALARVAGRRPAGLAHIIGRGAGKLLVTAEAGAWVNALALLETQKIEGRMNVYRALQFASGTQDAKQLADLRAQGEREIRRCDEIRPIVTEGAFVDAAFVFNAEPRAFEMTYAWGLRPNVPLAAAFATVDDGLLDLAAMKDSVAVGALYLSGSTALRALPRPGALKGGFKPLSAAMHECGGGGTLLALAYGWPQILALAIEEGLKGEPTVRPLVDNLRNVAIAFRKLSEDERQIEGVVLGSFGGPIATFFDPMADKLFGARKARKTKGRSVDTWSIKEPPNALLVRAAAAAGTSAYGIAFGGNPVVDWFWGRPAPRASKPGVIGAGRIDLPRLIAQFATSGPDAQMILPIAKNLGQLTGTLRLSGDTLTATGALEIR